jgi:hypothetical protein
MEPTQRTKNAPSIVTNVIEDNNIVHSVITVDIVERSPTPIIIYNVEGELDFLATKDDNKKNLDDT